MIYSTLQLPPLSIATRGRIANKRTAEAWKKRNIWLISGSWILLEPKYPVHKLIFFSKKVFNRTRYIKLLFPSCKSKRVSMVSFQIALSFPRTPLEPTKNHIYLRGKDIKNGKVVSWRISQCPCGILIIYSRDSRYFSHDESWAC